MTEFFGITNEDITLLKAFVPKECGEIVLHAKGKRGLIFKAQLGNKPVAIKVAHPQSEAHNAMTLESNYLKKVNALGVGPKLIDSSENYVVMDFIEGTLIGEFIKEANTEDLKKVLFMILEQLLKLDDAGINKFELTNPYKHIIVRKNLEPVLIDFERARFSSRVKNISQFAQYLTSKNILPILQEKKILLRERSFREAVNLYSQGTPILFGKYL